MNLHIAVSQLIFDLALPILANLDLVYNQSIASNFYSNSDTLKLELIEPIDMTSFWAGNMPWVVALIVGVLATLANLYISFRSTRNTKLQIQSSKEVSLAQIEQARYTVQREFSKTVLSGNRQAWINSLRDSISEYLARSKAFELGLSEHEGTDEKETRAYILSQLPEILRLKHKIVLMLNSEEDDSKELIKRLELFTKSLFDKEAITQPMEVLEDWVSEQAKVILKKEWERVKRGE